MIDILIIGAGPAGISSALYAKRAGADVKVLYYGESNLEKAGKIDNYYGFVNGVEAKSLYLDGISQAKNLGIDVIKEEVLNITKQDNSFLVETTKKSYEAKSVILATGNKKLRPDIRGINEYEGRGVSYCAICDGFFYRDKNVAVIGSGRFALNEAEHLKNIASTVTILTNGENSIEHVEFDKYKVIDKKIEELHGDKKISSIEFEDGEKLDIDGVFIAIGEAGGADFAKKIGVMMDGDNIAVDENMKTNIDGLYSCGDVVGGLKQICKATYEGAKAGLAAAKFVKK